MSAKIYDPGTNELMLLSMKTTLFLSTFLLLLRHRKDNKKHFNVQIYNELKEDNHMFAELTLDDNAHVR